MTYFYIENHWDALADKWYTQHAEHSEKRPMVYRLANGEYHNLQDRQLREPLNQPPHIARMYAWCKEQLSQFDVHQLHDPEIIGGNPRLMWFFVINDESESVMFKLRWKNS